jgi:hypothetical protein
VTAYINSIPLRSILKLSSHWHLFFQVVPSCQGFPNKILYVFLTFSMYFTCSVHLISLEIKNEIHKVNVSKKSSELLSLWICSLYLVTDMQGCICMLLTVTISSCKHSDIHMQTELSVLLLPMAHRWQDTKLIDTIRNKIDKSTVFAWTSLLFTI